MVIRFRLRSVLVLLSLIVLILPLAGIQVLRLYESALVRQTESELIAQAVMLVAAYRQKYVESQTDGQHGHAVDPAFAAEQKPRPRFSQLDLADSPIFDSFPDPLPGRTADPIAETVGRRIAAMIDETHGVMLASIRVVDHNGVVVASSADDLGASLERGEEIKAALLGQSVSRLRRRDAPQQPASLASISRGTAIRVFVASPIVENNRVLGAVMLSRTPANILHALYGKRYLLMQAGALILTVVVLVAIFASRTVVGPIQRLARDADAVARGEKETIGRERPYRTVEVDQLANRVREMARSLQQRSSYVRDFARHVSHEFKTPISAIAGAVEVLRDHVDTMTDDERRHFFDNIEVDLERLERLTQGLLELAHADMSKSTTETTSLAQLGVEGAAVTGDIHAQAKIGRDSLRASIDHLVNNARQHGASAVSVAAHANGASLEILVQDDGEGIPVSNHGRIFDPFFTTKRDCGGTGLGLAITKALVNNAGGDLEHLPSVGSGTTFRLTVPRVRAV